MSVVTITLPDTVKEYVDAQLASGEYSGVTEFFSRLLHEDQKRRAKENLKTKIRAAEAGGLEEMTPGYWDDVEMTFRERYSRGPST